MTTFVMSDDHFVFSIPLTCPLTLVEALRLLPRAWLGCPFACATRIRSSILSEPRTKERSDWSKWSESRMAINSHDHVFSRVTITLYFRFPLLVHLLWSGASLPPACVARIITRLLPRAWLGLSLASSRVRGSDVRSHARLGFVRVFFPSHARRSAATGVSGPNHEWQSIRISVSPLLVHLLWSGASPPPACVARMSVRMRDSDSFICRSSRGIRTLYRPVPAKCRP